MSEQNAFQMSDLLKAVKRTARTSKVKVRWR